MFDNMLCFIQVPRPKAKITKKEQAAPQLLEVLANDRQSQAGHMLNNLSTDSTALIRDVSVLHTFLWKALDFLLITFFPGLCRWWRRLQTVTVRSLCLSSSLDHRPLWRPPLSPMMTFTS